MSITAPRKQAVIAEFRRNAKDVGSPEVQAAILTDRIKALTEHLKSNPKDYATQRGLLAMVSNRSSLLRYLARTDKNAYLNLISRLGLRK